MEAASLSNNGRKKRRSLPLRFRQILPLKSKITPEIHSTSSKGTLKRCLLKDQKNGVGEREISGSLLIYFTHGK